MFDIVFEKLYKNKRTAEPCFIGIPVKQGLLCEKNLDKVMVCQDGKAVPLQVRPTSLHKDGTVRYLFMRFMADLNANQETVLQCALDGESEGLNALSKDTYDAMEVVENDYGIFVNTGAISFTLAHNGTHLFEQLTDARTTYHQDQFVGPYLIEESGEQYGMQLGRWTVVETGTVCTRLKNKGQCVGSRPVSFEIFINCYRDKEWFEIEYRLINTTEQALPIRALQFGIKQCVNSVLDFSVSAVHEEEVSRDKVFSFSGLKKAEEAMNRYPVAEGRYTVGNSNYKTHFSMCGSGSALERVADSALILKEGNEHYAEVLYGTFFADRTTKTDGICATIFQAQQNYPKAVKADDNGLMVMLVPEHTEKVVMGPGMSRNTKFMLHFHSPEMGVAEYEDRSLIYQMPDRPMVAPKVYAEAEVMHNVFLADELIDDDVEISLMDKCDAHGRCFGMLNWGDTPDAGYTNQNRGRGLPVWTNNEYDYPHACFLQYARTGVRRFLDYGLITAEHWMDVDVCHYSTNPLLMGGQWEHSARHIKDSTIVPSHSWVEGLLDYYHFTGNIRALETAVGIGENVLRLLETDTYKTNGESNARETGWALRTLTALYIETGEERWLEKADWIVDHFEEWAKEYGGWLASYTDNTSIRVGFMISVAIGSIMRYHRVFPSQRTHDMMVAAVEDLLENGMLPNGTFYYKELPSLKRVGNNTLLLEAMVIGFELTGDKKFLQAGKRTFDRQIRSNGSNAVNAKRVVEDAVIFEGNGTKNFAQSFIPLCTYYKTAREQGII